MNDSLIYEFLSCLDINIIDIESSVIKLFQDILIISKNKSKEELQKYLLNLIDSYYIPTEPNNTNNINNILKKNIEIAYYRIHMDSITLLKNLYNNLDVLSINEFQQLLKNEIRNCYKSK